MGDSYTDAHRALLHVFMARQVMTQDEAKAVVAAIQTVDEGRQIVAGDITFEMLGDYIAVINNKALRPYDYEIRTHLHAPRNSNGGDGGGAGGGGIRYYGFVNVKDDPLTQSATTYTADEIAFINRVLDAMFENHRRNDDMVVSSMDVFNLAKVSPDQRRRESMAQTTLTQTQPHSQSPVQAPTQTQTTGTINGLTMSAAENVIESLVQQGWFEKVRNGAYTLAPRGMMELRGYY